jgi:hypothetical protein
MTPRRRNPGRLSEIKLQLLQERHHAAMQVVNHVGREDRVLLLAYVVFPPREIFEAQLAARGL